MNRPNVELNQSFNNSPFNCYRKFVNNFKNEGWSLKILASTTFHCLTVLVLAVDGQAKCNRKKIPLSEIT